MFERVDIPDYLDMVRVYLLTILETCRSPERRKAPRGRGPFLAFGQGQIGMA